MANSDSLIVETKDLTHIYGEGAVTALDGVNIKISHGELVSIMGPSGSGKSTLLNMLGALDKPTSGEILINGENLEQLKDVDQFRTKTVGFIFQMHNLLPTLNGRENVEVPMVDIKSAKEKREKALHLLSLVGLSDRAKHMPNQLSGGQRQRVAIARSLANNAPLILADEPTGNLDSESGKELIQLIHHINENEKTTFVIVTHDPAVSRQTNRVIVMADGKMVREDNIGSPLEEDLKMWQHSGLGRRIMENQYEELKDLNITKKQIKFMQKILQQSDKS